MVGKVQVEQEEHVQSCHRAAQDEPRGLANGARDQHCHLEGGREGGREIKHEKGMCNKRGPICGTVSPLIQRPIRSAEGLNVAR